MTVEAEPLTTRIAATAAWRRPDLRNLLGVVARRIGDAARVVLPPVITIAILLAIWQIAMSGKAPPLPPPSEVLTKTWGLIIDPFFYKGASNQGLGWLIFVSLKRVALGFSIAAVGGILLGVLIGSSIVAYRGLDPVFQVLRTVPPLAWLPIALAGFHDNETSAIFVIAITAIWPIVMNTAVGIRNIPDDYRNVARVLQLNPVEFFFKITLPATVPYIFTGLKIGIGLSWLAIVAAEMLTGGSGIGFFLWDSYNSGLMSELILSLIWIGLVGLLLDRAITVVGRAVGGPGTF